jgi:hypothetical protein
MRMKDLIVSFRAYVNSIRGKDDEGLDVLYAVNYTYNEVSADTTLTWKHNFIGVNSPTESVTLTLETSPKKGRPVHIKDIGMNASTFPIRILAPGNAKIDRSDTAVLSRNGEAVTLLFDGTNWLVY